FVFSISVLAGEDESLQPVKIQEKKGITSEEKTTDSNFEQSSIEKITIIGRNWLPQEVEISGQYILSRDFLDRAIVDNGNITDLLTILPGVQGDENALNIEKQQEIKSQLISISGGRPSDTGFYIDGQSNSSLIDPDASSLAVTSVNDVQGHPQQTFVNQNIVRSVKVFDSNIPVEYGGFSGGVVDVELRDYDETPSFQFGYRSSSSQFNKYFLIDEVDYNSNEDPDFNPETPSKPEFNKSSYNLLASKAITKNQFLSLSMSKTTSTITDISLLKPVITERESMNLSVNYTLKKVLLDKISLSMNHSPYSGDYILTDTINSDYTIKGGGTFGALRLEHSFEGFDWQSSLRYGQSENSRTAPQVYLPWARAKGKEWGVDTGDFPLSKEGGYGDLDKYQKSFSLKNTFNANSFDLIGFEHSFSGGIDFSRINLQRLRATPYLEYKSPLRDSNINCGSNSFDCIEQSYKVPLEELATQLGSEIDLTLKEHYQAYGNNLENRGQFFQLRRVYPIENIDVSLNSLGMYIQNSFSAKNLSGRIGFRVDHNDFLNHWNFAPRLHLGYDLFSNKESMFVFGASRYYANDMMSYKVKEAQRSYLTQYRPIFKGILQPWITSSEVPQYRYLYDGLNTPYSDELTVGFKQQLFSGVLSLNYVKRKSKDKVVRGDSFVKNGLTHIYQTNEGKSSHNRYSLSYSTSFFSSSFMFNVSKTENKSNAESSDESVENIPDDELIYLEEENYTLISRDGLTILQDNFSRPVTANLSLSTDITDSIQSTFNVSYTGKYESYEYTGQERSVERGDIVCPGCNVTMIEYPVFKQIERRPRTMVSLRLAYQYAINEKHDLDLSLSIKNLLNSRTYTVTPGTIGLETGRSFWLGVNYRYN
ncbi:hypothetical protein ACT3RM_17385, partial [Pseudoalteromonas sp. AOP7-A1-14]|uniref:hypothetical protein n=1 Tax=Pseudoalteromonas sp. AOP7-A1-14 TaxID=3457648 RepID=UPI00402B912F